MDIISFNEAATANGRIDNFIENPDSASGIVTVPKVIASGETVTIPAGRIAVLPNVQVDGELNVEGEIFVPSGSTVDFTNCITVDGNRLVMSVPTAYHIYNGSVEATNTVLTNGFSTTLYARTSGTSWQVITGVDMNTQWGNDTSEKFGGLVWHKDRVTAGAGHVLYDTIRGVNKYIQTNLTNAEGTLTDGLLSFNNDGFNIGTNNTLNASHVSWNFQTTHRKTGVTNHGKAYTEHYNPYTGFTIIKYEGSGLAGHEIPHSLGRKLGIRMHKNLSAVANWNIMGTVLGDTNYLVFTTDTVYGSYTNVNLDGKSVLGTGGDNTSTHQFIMYGWVNSYYDTDNTLIGNYEIGVYQGTGVAGNKVTTRGKPAWVMVKRLDAVDNWVTMDNIRSSFDAYLIPNTADAEIALDMFNISVDGFTATGTNLNISGGQYLYMVVYDNDSGSGKSKYPKATDTTNLTINALVPYANGIDVNGSKVSISYKNETISGLTLTQGKNYPYSKNDGTYGSKTVAPNYGITNPLTGDFFNLKTLKWYDNTNAEIVPRTYLDCVVYADHNGQVEYVEELPKIEYVDKIKANEFQGKNACTAWVNFDGTTTPPTIRDSYNVSSVVRIAVGRYEIYFKKMMDNLNFSVVGGSCRAVTWADGGIGIPPISSYNKVAIENIENNTGANTLMFNVHIYGGKL